MFRNNDSSIKTEKFFNALFFCLDAKEPKNQD